MVTNQFLSCNKRNQSISNKCWILMGSIATCSIDLKIGVFSTKHVINPHSISTYLKIWRRQWVIILVTYWDVHTRHRGYQIAVSKVQRPTCCSPRAKWATTGCLFPVRKNGQRNAGWGWLKTTDKLVQTGDGRMGCMQGGREDWDAKWLC